MFDYLNKKTTEWYAIKELSYFYEEYKYYVHPKEDDNFDFISPDGITGLEITTIIPKDYLNQFENEKIIAKGIKSSHKIECYSLGNGKIAFHGGSLKEIIDITAKRINNKSEKAEKRIINGQSQKAELCLLIEDGNLFDEFSFESIKPIIEKSIFKKLYIITSQFVIYYNCESKILKCCKKQ